MPIAASDAETFSSAYIVMHEVGFAMESIVLFCTMEENGESETTFFSEVIFTP